MAQTTPLHVNVLQQIQHY